jgi:hypothetical protein
MTAEQIGAILQVKLFDIKEALPETAASKLRNASIWIASFDSITECMTYHSSAGWLRVHGHNPDMAGGIEIANPEVFLRRIKSEPWMVFHELSHYYHDRIIGRGNSEIAMTYQAALESHRYERVLFYNGATTRAYALANEMEYFAESSESFFGVNCYYPFVRAELKQYDPRMYELLIKLWHVADEALPRW